MKSIDERIEECKRLIQGLESEIGTDYQFADKNRLTLGTLKFVLETELENLMFIKELGGE